MYGLGSRGGTPGGRFGGAFPVKHKTMKIKSEKGKQINTNIIV